jgi:hypothetical protein
MSQYVIDIKESKQADALIQYLKSLDFVVVKPLQQDRKHQAAGAAKSFLNGLPNQSAKQSEVNQAVKSIRKKHGYQ